jgi:hypothetical protein
VTTFTKINEAVVTCSDGYMIKISHTHLAYKEGKKAASIDVEYTVVSPEMVLYPETLTGWFPPFAEEAMPDSKKSEILRRVCDALDFLGRPYHLE